MEPTSAKDAGGDLSLVLVNDDPAQLMVQKRLLGKVARVQGYLSPLEALAAARLGESSPFLITDFHMPDMDGPELARVWCDLHDDARVLVISASEVSRQEQDKIDALPERAVRLLTSYRITELQDHARNWFCQQPSVAQESTPAASGETRLDRGVLEKLGKLGGAAFVGKTIARFKQSGPEKVAGIQAGLLAGDHSRIHELSHALKGSCGLVGALTLAAAADRIEIATGEGGDSRDLDRLVSDLVAESQATVQELEAFEL